VFTEVAVMDFFHILAICGLFATAWGLVRLCERVR